MGIFKGKLDINKSVETVSNAVDKLFFTDEEKADQFMKIADKTVEFYGKTLEENTTRSKTRRFVAFSVIISVLATFFLCIVLVLINKPIDKILELVSVFNLPMAFITVIAFFFGGYYMKNIKLRSDRKEKKE